MTRHHFTLEHIARELTELMVGRRILQCFSQDPNVIVFECGMPESESVFLEADFSFGGGAIFTRHRFARAKRNSRDVLQSLWGEVILSVEKVASDRAMVLHFQRVDCLITLYGKVAGNALAVRSGKCIDAFKQRSELTDSSPQQERLYDRSLFSFASSDSLLHALSNCNLQLGRFYSIELCERLGLDPAQQLASISTDVLNSAALALTDECLSSREFFVLEESGFPSPALSLIPLKSYPVMETHSSVLSAIRSVVIAERRTKSFDGLTRELDKKLREKKRKTEVTISKMITESRGVEKAVTFEQWGTLLLHAEDGSKKGQTELEARTWEENQVVTIELDPKLSVRENAEKYFAKAKHSRKVARDRAKRLPSLEEIVAQLELSLAELEKADSTDEIVTLAKKNSIRLTVMDQKKTGTTESELFRSFDLGEGYTLYVGKTAENNDRLTMKFAKQNDLWLHARGVSGSHAVLRGPNPAKPSKRVLQIACEITAYYSSARNGGYVPVCYTLKKNVRKPKGGNIGAVVIDKEEVMMVNPKLPGGAEA